VRGEIKMRTIDDFTVPKEYISPENKYIGGIIREFVDEEVMPYRRKFDEDWKELKYARDLLKKAEVGLGLQKALWPVEFGGWGMGSSDYVGVISMRMFEELGRGDTALSLTFGANFWAPLAITVKPHINRELCAELAPMFCDTNELRLTCLAMTEPQGGSDIENVDAEHGRTIQTTAELDGDEWVINGHKIWPSNSGEAYLYAVICTTKRGSRDDKDIAYIYVPRDTKGLKVGEPYHKAGISFDANTDIWFDDVRVPKMYRAWGPGDDAKYFKEVTNWGSMAGAYSLGPMINTYEVLKDYCEKKTFHGKPLKENHAVAGVLSDIAMDIEVTRILGYQYGRMLDRPEIYGDRWSPEITAHGKIFKNFAAERAVDVSNKAMDIMGLYGPDRDHDMEKNWRDIKMTQLWEGGKQLGQAEIARYFYECETL